MNSHDAARGREGVFQVFWHQIHDAASVPQGTREMHHFAVSPWVFYLVAAFLRVVGPLEVIFGFRRSFPGRLLSFANTVSELGAAHSNSNNPCRKSQVKARHGFGSSIQAARKPPWRLASHLLSIFRVRGIEQSAWPGSKPSLKRSANGMSRWPSSAGPAAHFALAVQRAMPLAPA